MNRFILPRPLRLPLLVIALTLTAIAAVAVLENHADSSRQAQLRVSSLKVALIDLDGAPFGANPTAGSASAARARSQIQADERTLSRGIGIGSRVQGSASSLGAAESDLLSIESNVAALYTLTSLPVTVARIKQIRTLQTDLVAHTQRLSSTLGRIGQSDADRSRSARIEAEVGTTFALLVLVGVFMIFYVRALRAQRENVRLLNASRLEASTDSLTGLGNRRALIDTLTNEVSSLEREPELLLAIFDLNGFKQYNDTFGHVAGDDLLARLGGRLAAVAGPAGSAYRLGGDEFCMVARRTPEAAEGLLTTATSALADQGDGWKIDCSYGSVWIPSEASTVSGALTIADHHMYADKATRPVVSWPVAKAAITPRGEQDNDLLGRVGNDVDSEGHAREALVPPPGRDGAPSLMDTGPRRRQYRDSGPVFDVFGSITGGQTEGSGSDL